MSPAAYQKKKWNHEKEVKNLIMLISKYNQKKRKKKPLSVDYYRIGLHIYNFV